MQISSNGFLVNRYHTALKDWLRYVLIGTDADGYATPSTIPYDERPFVFSAMHSLTASTLVIAKMDGSSGSWSWRQDSALGYNLWLGRFGNTQISSLTSDVWLWLSVIAQIIRFFPGDDRKEMMDWLQACVAMVLAQQVSGVNTSVFETVEGAPIHRIAVNSESQMWAEVTSSAGVTRWLDINGQTVETLPTNVRILEV